MKRRLILIAQAFHDLRAAHWSVRLWWFIRQADRETIREW